jgi:hypothetical protein
LRIPCKPDCRSYLQLLGICSSYLTNSCQSLGVRTRSLKILYGKPHPPRKPTDRPRLWPAATVIHAGNAPHRSPRAGLFGFNEIEILVPLVGSRERELQISWRQVFVSHGRSRTHRRRYLGLSMQPTYTVYGSVDFFRRQSPALRVPRQAKD